MIGLNTKASSISQKEKEALQMTSTGGKRGSEKRERRKMNT